MTAPPRPRAKLQIAGLALAALPLLLAGCEAEAVELAAELQAARGDCTAEGLRRTDEGCIRMMERYAGMGTELMHTYIGGLRALDVALDRLPPPGFDTVGLGYALSPEFRGGDPYGPGGSPRLAPASLGLADRQFPVTRPDVRGGTASPSVRREGAGRRPPVSRREPERSRGAARPLPDPRDPRRDHGRTFGLGPQRYGYGDAYRYLESGPGGYFNPSPYTYFYGLDGYGGRDWIAGPDGYAYGGMRYGYDGYGYGYADRFGGGYGFGYVPSAPYGYGFDSGYLPRGWNDYGYGYSSGYAPVDPYGRQYGYDYSPGFDPRVDPYAGGYVPRPPYGWDGYGDSYDDPRGIDGAAYWDYDAAADDPYAAGDADFGDPADGDEPPYDAPERDGVAAPAAAPAGPPRHRPGILLPPEERLRRPWLND